ncbi:hypothetical protein [Mycobacteroides chelonae]|uniref:VG15 protein n=1 Tax=Mycobacteroides chelonae TaxID=1774 RepID=UPI0004A9EC9A|nr:hypothetical protein [Mycobacteroides chelonae]OHT67773.1 hypothetical protein BKG66_24405 [Mycobacteroides chelonae]OHT69416.1 hypothetical protein BKG67_22940 [Mycobacteroides chelonae]
MTPEEYAARQALISAATAQFVLDFASMFVRPTLSLTEWVLLLNMMFPEIQRRREESASLAREFYDSQREQFHPDLPRNDRYLEGSQFEVFVKDMEPARKKMSQADSPEDALTMLTLKATRSVENAGRRQIINAVANDPEPSVLKGWARVATGRETCAWCLMLISRGPTYMSADTAGLDIDDTKAVRLFQKGDLSTYFEDISDHMDEWHPGCDCKAVPVFDSENWFGKAAEDAALELWKDASTEADRLIKSGEARTDNRNTEAINALRRRLDRGDINPTDYAALAA